MLEGKVALITGAGQGVGQGIALAMAAKGASIAVTGRTLSKLEDTCALIEQRGGKAIAISCNVKDSASLKFWSTMPRKCPWAVSTMSATSFLKLAGNLAHLPPCV